MKQISLIGLPSIKSGVSLLKVKEKFCSSGKKDRPVYKYVYDEKYGCPRRVLSGYINQFDFIQESRDSVDFKSLGKMLIDNKANIVDHFISKDGEVIDITGQPRDIHEASRMYNELHESFDNLPLEIKALFENDFDTFRASYKAGTLGSKIDAYYKSITPVVPTTEEKGE